MPDSIAQCLDQELFYTWSEQLKTTYILMDCKKTLHIIAQLFGKRKQNSVIVYHFLKFTEDLMCEFDAVSSISLVLLQYLLKDITCAMIIYQLYMYRNLYVLEF